MTFPLSGEGAAPHPGAGARRLTGGMPKRVQTPELGSQAPPALHAHRKRTRVTYWIFLVKFLDTMPPSCCFSS